MKNQYKNIKKLIEHGSLVEIKNLEDGKYCVTSDIDCDNDLHTSMWMKDIKKCYEKLRHDFFQEKFVNELDLEIKAVPRVYKVITNGSKVDIIDCKELRETLDNSYDFYSDKAIEMIGQKGLEVSEFNDIEEGQSYEIYNREYTALYTFPAWAVIPHIKKEEEEMIEIFGDKYIKREYMDAVKKLKKVE